MSVRNEKDPDGKWRLKSKSCIGSIKDKLGFIPNKNGSKYAGNSILEYGQYELVYNATNHLFEELKEFFDPLVSARCYALALIYVINGYKPLDSIAEYISQSILSLKYPGVSFSEYILKNLLEGFGRSDDLIIKYQQSLINKADNIAIDTHAIKSYSHNNELAEYGNKYSQLNEKQINLLMAYDIDKEMPLLSRLFPGKVVDKYSIQSMLSLFTISNKLLIMDRGFYSEANLNLFTSLNNKYIIPLSVNLKEYKNEIEKFSFEKGFVYRVDRKKFAIYATNIVKDDKTRIIIYKDMDRSIFEEDAYTDKLEDDGQYSEEAVELEKKHFGVIMLKTNLMKETPKEIFELYKRRWKIESYYNIVKNRQNFKTLCSGDYYISQGISFIILLAGRIEQTFRAKCKENKIKNVSKFLLEARGVKVRKSNDGWIPSVKNNSVVEMFNAFDTKAIGILDL